MLIIKPTIIDIIFIYVLFLNQLDARDWQTISSKKDYCCLSPSRIRQLKVPAF